MDDDAATSPQASYCPDMAALDTELDELREIVALPREVATQALGVWFANRNLRDGAADRGAEMFRVCLTQLLESRRPKQDAWVWACAAGMECTMGVELKALGRRFGTSKSNMSKRVNDLIDRFGLSRNRNVESEATRRIQRLAQLRRHGHVDVLDPNLSTGRQLTERSIEGVLLRFLGWQRANNADATMRTWPMNRLAVIRRSLLPVVVFARRVDLAWKERLS